ncbi:MAG: dihydrodipicolinate synthase family protein [Armatimonadetes bacterium]|nr:dihydrodipicolinate synthase family protein [Armatimonadota bacterium]MDE2206598.1 dihydrodipicolinate synthase family protein [Armatimonadota bacterium]
METPEAIRSGLIAPPHTPFTPDGNLDTSRIVRQADRFVRTGITGVFVCGSTGEGLSLTSAERRTVLEAWVAASAGRLVVIAHVGCTSAQEARELATHAKAVGADAIGALPPFYHSPATIEDLVRTMRFIADGAVDLPFYYYHIPMLSHVQLPMLAFADQAVEQIPNFAGIKYTHNHLVEYTALREAHPDLAMFWGLDELLVPAMSCGCVAAVGSCYNLAARFFLKMMAAYRGGDLQDALAHHQTAVQFVSKLLPLGVVPSQKAILAGLGLDLGPPRLPLRSPDPPEAARLFDAVSRLGLLDVEPQ